MQVDVVEGADKELNPFLLLEDDGASLGDGGIGVVALLAPRDGHQSKVRHDSPILRVYEGKKAVQNPLNLQLAGGQQRIT